MTDLTMTEKRGAKNTEIKENQKKGSK